MATTTGSTGYPQWGLSFSYDRYGNRLTQNVIAGSAYADTQTYGTSYPNNGAYTNRPDGHSYDASGNMLGDGVNTLTYDAAGKLITASVSGTGVGAYGYDGRGLRVQKCVPNCTSPTTKTIYIFAGSKVIAEYDNPSGSTPSPTREYIYSGKKLVAKITSSATNYFLRDHLSNRVITDSSGSVIEQLGHYPYGEPWYDTGSEKWKFSTHEHDSETSNEYAMARYLVSRLGRFSSPDLHSGRRANPQSLNRYAYVLDDPINLLDPLGLDAEGSCWWGSSEDGSTANGGAGSGDCVVGGGAWCDKLGCMWSVGGLGIQTGNLQDYINSDNGSDIDDIDDSLSDLDSGNVGFGIISVGTGASPLNTAPPNPWDPVPGDYILPASQDIFHQSQFCNPCGGWFHGASSMVNTMVAVESGMAGIAAAAPAVVTGLVTGAGWIYAASGTGMGGVVVIGTNPEYLDAAESFGAWAIDVGTNTWSFLEDIGQAGTFNTSVLQMANWLGNNFIQAGSKSYGYLVTEVEYLEQLGAPIAKVPW
jgi:RHS repeat-associated protein